MKHRSVPLQLNTNNLKSKQSQALVLIYFLRSAGVREESQLALAHENTTVCSNGPMSVGWGWAQQRLEQHRGAMVTDPSLSWIKLLVSSCGSSSGVTWDQLPMLSSLLALIERLSLFTTAATTTAGLSLSLPGGEQTATWWEWPATGCSQCRLNFDLSFYLFMHFFLFRLISIFQISIETIYATHYDTH